MTRSHATACRRTRMAEELLRHRCHRRAASCCSPVVWLAVHLGASIDHRGRTERRTRSCSSSTWSGEDPVASGRHVRRSVASCLVRGCYRRSLAMIDLARTARAESWSTPGPAAAPQRQGAAPLHRPAPRPGRRRGGPGLALGRDVVSGQVDPPELGGRGRHDRRRPDGQDHHPGGPGHPGRPGGGLHVLEQARRGGPHRRDPAESAKAPGVALRPPGHRRGQAHLVVEPARHGRRPRRCPDARRSLRRGQPPTGRHSATPTSTPKARSCWPSCCWPPACATSRSPPSTSGSRRAGTTGSSTGWPQPATTWPPRRCSTS